MTDSSQFLPNQQGITSDLFYNLKPSSASSRSYRCSIPTSNKSVFSPNDTAIAYIPARRNCFLDTTQSYIKYTIKNNETTVGNTFKLDNNGASVLNRLDVFHGSNLLESVQQYNALYTYLLDNQLTFAQRMGLSGMYGTSPTVGTQASTRQGQQIAINGNQLTVCMPILSGVVGALSDKMLPLNLADDIRLEFTFESNNAGVVYTAGPAAGVQWSVLGVELELQIVELGESGMAMIDSVTPLSQPLFLHGTSYRHYVSSLPSGTAGSYSTLVPARFASLKNLICLPRRSTEITSATSYSTSSRVNPNIASYWWRVGSLIIPQKYVQLSGNSVGGYSEAFAEIQKSFHALNHAEYAGSVGWMVYNVADAADVTIGDGGTSSSVLALSTGADSYKNGFAIATELEAFAQRNDTILSGINTLGSQVFFEFNSNGTGTGQAYTLDFYGCFDQILILADGLLSIKF